MKIEICTKEHMASMIMMPSGSDAQNHALHASLMSEEILLEQCYIMLQDQSVVCRIVIDEKRNYLGSFTVEDIAQEEINHFLDVVLNKLNRTKTWRIDLYSDKVHYHRIYSALQAHFPIKIQRESYTAKTRITDTSSWVFKNAHEMNKEALLQLMMNTCHTSLDTMIQREQQELGLRNAILRLMDELLEDEESNALFQILWIYDQPIGFLSILASFKMLVVLVF